MKKLGKNETLSHANLKNETAAVNNWASGSSIRSCQFYGQTDPDVHQGDAGPPYLVQGAVHLVGYGNLSDVKVEGCYFRHVSRAVYVWCRGFTFDHWDDSPVRRVDLSYLSVGGENVGKPGHRETILIHGVNKPKARSEFRDSSIRHVSIRPEHAGNITFWLCSLRNVHVFDVNAPSCSIQVHLLPHNVVDDVSFLDVSVDRVQFFVHPDFPPENLGRVRVDDDKRVEFYLAEVRGWHGNVLIGDFDSVGEARRYMIEQLGGRSQFPRQERGAEDMDWG